MAKQFAVVAGATGVVGYELIKQLSAEPDWEVIGLARRAVHIPGARFISIDLRDREQCAAQLSELTETTHIFYAVRFDHIAGTPEPVDINLAMLRNVVDAIEPVARNLKHIHLVQGTKWYGSNLGPFPTPAREDDPRSLAPNFYYDQQDYVANKQEGKSWNWSASRPHGLLHDVPNTPRNLVLVIAAYALISKELGLPLCFPGTQANYEAIYQCTSTRHLAEAIRFIVDAPACANEAFNVTNGDYIRWSRLWPVFARYFGMEVGPVRTVRLAEVMADKAEVWQRIVSRHGLKNTPYERLALWDYGDFVFTPGWDMMSDTTKLRQAGFAPVVRTEDEFIRYFEHFRTVGILP